MKSALAGRAGVKSIPWLGFIVYAAHRRVKGRKVRSATRRLRERLDDYHAGRMTFAEMDASVQGWVNYVRYADTWGLQSHMFGQPWFRVRPHARTTRGPVAEST